MADSEENPLKLIADKQVVLKKETWKAEQITGEKSDQIYGKDLRQFCRKTLFFLCFLSLSSLFRSSLSFQFFFFFILPLLFFFRADQLILTMANLFEDLFEVIKKDPDGKKFDRVSRIVAKSDNDVQMTLDVHNELFKVKVGERISVLLTSTLNRGLFSVRPSTLSFRTFFFLFHRSLCSLLSRVRRFLDVGVV